MPDVRIEVDGEVIEAHVEARLLLVHFLRDVAAKTGTVVGCDTSSCGACTVLLNGQSVYSCTTLAISAQLEDSDAKGLNGDQENDRAQEAGSVFVYTRTGSTWTQRVYLKAANNEAFDEFGSSMALSRDGRTLVVGARGEDSGAKGINGNQNDNSVKEAGAVEVFAINPAGK